MKFSCPEHALRWAYETSSRPIVKISSVNEMREDNSIRPTAEMTPYDRHAQAALIMGLCERVLSQLHMAYVLVQFGRDSSCIDLLSRHIAGTFGTGLHSRRGIEQIIRSYCGEKIGHRQIRKSMQCDARKVSSFIDHGYDVMDVIHGQAMDILYKEMDNRFLLMKPYKITALL